jgi:hypothetical protein
VASVHLKVLFKMRLDRESIKIMLYKVFLNGFDVKISKPMKNI